MRYLFLLLIFISCATSKNRPSDSTSGYKLENIDGLLDAAENRASFEGRKILSTGRSMIKKKTILRGGCWDYVNAVFMNSGFPERKRRMPFKGKFKGPYTDNNAIEPGDWLYFVNHSYNDRDHSGIFVDWVDAEKKRGVILSYVGGKKKKPGNYRVYDLSHVYNIIRPK